MQREELDSKWHVHMKAVAGKADSPEGTTMKKKATKPRWDERLTEPDKKAEQSKKKAAVGQSPSKQKVAVQLTRAPISQPTKETTTPVFQEPQPQPTPQVVEPPPMVAPQAEPVPVAEGQPPVAVQQAGPAFPKSPPLIPFQTFQQVDPGLAKKLEGWQADEWAEAMRKCTKVEKDEEFQRVV